MGTGQILGILAKGVRHHRPKRRCLPELSRTWIYLTCPQRGPPTYLGSVLPDLADFPINGVAELLNSRPALGQPGSNPSKSGGAVKPVFVDVYNLTCPQRALRAVERSKWGQVKY
jgi:hypothetical protein